MSTLAHDVSGAGKPLVLLHGWCGRRGHMAGLATHFSKTHRVYSVDLPGHGESKLERTPLTLEGFAEAVGRFLDEQDLRNVVLVGHSMGGVISVFTAGMRPGRVAGVVNLDGALPLKAAAREGYKALFASIQEQGFRALFPEFVRKVFFLPEELGAVAEGIISDMVAAPEERAVELLRQFPSVNAGKALNEAHAPLLYIGGSHPRFDESAVLALRPDAWIARVAMSGHFVQIFALPQIIPMIERFLERTEG